MQPRPDASPEALQLTRACFQTFPVAGGYCALVFVPPGGDLRRDGLTLERSWPPDRVEGAVDALAAVFAPLVDLGINRGRAQRGGILAIGTPASRLTPPVPPEAQTCEVAPIVEDGDDGAGA